MLVNTLTARGGPEVRVLAGACDGLSTPRPLGPVVDMARTAPDVAEILHDAAGHAFLAGFLDLLSTPGRPTIVVIEDVHWADESTLDLIRYLGRRLDGTFALVLATYRPDELHAAHPLRGVVGDLATAKAVSRIVLEPLSEAGVAELTGDHDVDAAQLHRRTGGNPFFVTEVLAHPTEDIPATVRDAVLARRSRLPEDAHEVLDLVSVAPGAMELSVLEHIIRKGHAGLDACVVAGMLEPRAGPAVGFRHELARLAVADAVPPARWRDLNATVCGALLAGEHPDPARVSHHADIAGDGVHSRVADRPARMHGVRR